MGKSYCIADFSCLSWHKTRSNLRSMISMFEGKYTSGRRLMARSANIPTPVRMNAASCAQVDEIEPLAMRSSSHVFTPAAARWLIT